MKKAYFLSKNTKIFGLASLGHPRLTVFLNKTDVEKYLKQNLKYHLKNRPKISKKIEKLMSKNEVKSKTGGCLGVSGFKSRSRLGF